VERHLHHDRRQLINTASCYIRSSASSCFVVSPAIDIGAVGGGTSVPGVPSTNDGGISAAQLGNGFLELTGDAVLQSRCANGVMLLLGAKEEAPRGPGPGGVALESRAAFATSFAPAPS
jgi:hypothetical protein